MSARDLIVGEAELDDEADESFDEDTGEARRKMNGSNGVNGVNGHLDDSSEEDEDDEDEEAARAVQCSCRIVSQKCPTQADARILAYRSERVSLLTRKMRTQSSVLLGNKSARNGGERSVMKRRPVWTMRIWT